MSDRVLRIFAIVIALAAVVCGVLVGATEVFAPKTIRILALVLSVATALQAALPRVFGGGFAIADEKLPLPGGGK